jgi:hypothetical protein
MTAETRNPEQRIRDGLIALADYLTDRDDYDIPDDVLRALCPDVDDETRGMYFHALLLATAERGPDRSRPLPHAAEIELDYLTGARR